jgi:LDH2 family malate/lactate/ureidoglycolate dehydrogenase
VIYMQVALETARRMCQAVFTRIETPEHIARVAIEALIEANLRGIDSHGIQLLPLYLDLADKGRLHAGIEPEVVVETAASAVLDAHQGDGFYASMEATQRAVDKAQVCGLAAVVVRQNNHNGAISHYAIHAARNGLIGLAATACAPRVTPFGGQQGLHGTNPIAYGIPAGTADPIVFDFSTGYSAAKLKARAAQTGGRLPADSVLDPAGRPSTDLEDLATGWILPVAGPIGYGLGLLVDALCCGLADSPIGQQIPPLSRTDLPYHGTFFILALDPAVFGGAEAFAQRVQTLLEQIGASEPLDPEQPVRFPGQRGWELRQQRLRQGIPLADQAWEQLLEALAERGVTAADWA